MRNKWIYIAIFILTIADALFTTLGVKDGFIEEANPLLQSVFHASPELSALLIVVGVGLILLLIYKVQHRIRWINYGLGAMLAVKLYILGLHFNWISQVI
jgi:hypothetical protein